MDCLVDLLRADVDQLSSGAKSFRAHVPDARGSPRIGWEDPWTANPFDALAENRQYPKVSAQMFLAFY